MIDKNVLQRILALAINAPSGANSQPWGFLVTKESKIRILSQPEKDHPILNYRNRGTLLAIGALLENIEQASLLENYSIKTGPYNHSEHFIDIEFIKNNTKPTNPLGAFINDRTTNRKVYENKKLTENISISHTQVPVSFYLT